MYKSVLGTYIIWMIVINVFAFYALNRFNLSPDTAYNWINPIEFHQDKLLNIIDLRVHWDSFWYLKIASEGYKYIPGQMTSIAFFPLYPSLIWTISQLTIPPALAGWIISTIALGVGLIYLYKLVKKFHPEIDPLGPVVLLLIFPTAFFLNSVYTESLFLALSIIFFYFLLSKRFFMAAIFLSLASLCRMNGLFLLLPFAFEYFRVYGIKSKFNINILSFPTTLLGILGFMTYQYINFNQPLAFLKSQVEWGRKFTLNSEHFLLTTPSSYMNFSTDLLFFIICIVTGILLMKYLRASYGVYVLTTALVAVSTGTLMSMSRLTLILFPIFILVASIKNPQIKFGWQLLSTLLLAIFTTLFVNNYWAG